MRTEKQSNRTGNPDKKQGTNSPAARGFWRLTTCLLTLSSSLQLAQAATSVFGDVTGTWTSNNSPYLVTADVRAYDLTIHPGVEVRFQGPYVFEVPTTLQALGTSNAPIVFTNAPGVAGWNGFYFPNSGPISLSYCRIYGSTNSGISILNCSPILTGCVIARNTSSSFGGGAVFINGGSVLIDRCSISNNSTAGSAWGGGLCLVAGNLQVRNTMINNNSSSGRYGAVGVQGGNPTLLNSLIISNSGAGMLLDHNQHASIVNCTLVGNSDVAIAGGNSTVLLTNSILYFNNAGGTQVALDILSTLVFDYCDVQGDIQPGRGNTNANPGLYPGNLSLAPGSPCIDGGSPDLADNDVCLAPCGLSQGSMTNDMGAYGGPGACGWTSPCCPEFVAQPQDQAGCLSHPAAFCVSATGSAPHPRSVQYMRRQKSKFLSVTVRPASKPPRLSSTELPENRLDGRRNFSRI